MIGHTPIEQLGGENPPALPELPRITRYTRVPVRVIGMPVWTDRAITAMVELYRQHRIANDAAAQVADR